GAVLAIHPIAVGAADEPIVAAAAVEVIVPAAADQGIGAADIGRLVDEARGRADPIGGVVGTGQGIARERVVAGAAVEVIAPQVAVEGVVAGAAVELVADLGLLLGDGGRRGGVVDGRERLEVVVVRLAVGDHGGAAPEALAGLAAGSVAGVAE